MNKSFSTLVPSTKTIISVLNINIDIEKLFEKLELTDYVFAETKRGRRRNSEIVNVNVNIPNGSIISVKFGNRSRGSVKKPKNENSKFFRNTLTIVMMLDDRLMNFKIFTANNSIDIGNKTQHPGCKDVLNAERVLLHLWDKIKDFDCYEFINNEKNLSILFHTVMTNVNFNIGYMVNREKLNEIMNRYDNYISMLEMEIGHAGTNITQYVKEKIVIDDMPKITLIDGEVVRELTTFEEYLNKLTPKQRTIQLKKQIKNTFIVFYSGKTIHSGFIPKYMDGAYTDFIRIMEELRPEIEEKNLI